MVHVNLDSASSDDGFGGASSDGGGSLVRSLASSTNSRSFSRRELLKTTHHSWKSTKKGAKSLHRTGLSLRKPPRQPGAEELRNMGRKFPPNHLHESWMDFLYWDAELEA